MCHIWALPLCSPINRKLYRSVQGQLAVSDVVQVERVREVEGQRKPF